MNGALESGASALINFIENFILFIFTLFNFLSISNSSFTFSKDDNILVNNLNI